MKLVAESLYESRLLCEFQRTGSVYKTMGLGMEEALNQAYQKMGYLRKDPGTFYPYKRPLWIAARTGRPDLVRYVLALGSNPTDNDSAALRWACGLGHVEVAKVLLDAGADLHAEGTLSWWGKRKYLGEAFAWATRNGHQEILSVLARAEKGEIFFPKAEPVAKKVEVPEEPEIQEPEVQEPELETADVADERGGWY